MAVVKTIDLEVRTKEAEEAVKKLTARVEQLEEQNKSLQKTTKKTTKGFKGLSVGVKALGASLKASGIGLVVALFAKMGDLLLQNQKAVDFVTTAWIALGTVMKDIGNAILNFDETLVSIGDTIKNIVLDRVEATIKGITGLGSAIMKFFEGDFVGAVATGEQAVNDLFDIGDTARELIEDTKEYTTSVYDQAEAYVELANAAKLAEAQLAGLIARGETDAERQRQIRDDIRLSGAERIAANEKLGEIIDDLADKEVQLAQIRLRAAQENLRLQGDTIDNQIAVIEAQTALADAEDRRQTARSEFLTNQAALEQEILTARQEEIGQTLELDNLVTDNKKKNLDQQVQDTLDANARTKEANEQLAAANAAIAQKEAAAKEAALDATGQALTNLSLIAGQETAAGKALAIAASLINTYQGITKSIAVGGFAGIAQAVAVGAAGFAAVANIVKTPVPNEGGAQAKGSAPSAPAAPSFNVVGTSPINQVAETLNQDQEPVQAFVVGSNVTTQQELDRNIVDTATIG